MVRVAVASLALLMLGAASAKAQDLSGFAGMIAAGEEELGQSFGQAVFAGPSIFVTARGQAKLPSPLADAYFVTATGKSPSAVEAARQRDAKIAQLRQVARRFGVEIQVGQSTYALEVDTEEQARLIRERNEARRAANPNAIQVYAPEASEPPPKVFFARANVRFREPTGANMPAFLDALRAAGIEDFHGGLQSASNPLMQRAGEFLGFGSVDTLDEGIWRSASEDAVRSARNQAQYLAAASGRGLGDVRQVIVLTRSVSDGAAVVSVAVRFGLAAAPH